METNLGIMPLTALLNLYSRILRELVQRNFCHSTNNPVADIAELLVTKALDLTATPKSTKGYDAVDVSGKRYEIKGRRITADNPSRMLSAIRDCESKHFDYLAGVLFLEDFAFAKACLVPFALVLQRSTYREHVNGHIFELKDELWSLPGVVDISEQVAGALARFDTLPASP